MPEVFQEYFSFPDQAAVPSLELVRERIAEALGAPAQHVDGKTYPFSTGSQPSERTFIRFRCGETEVTLIHDRPGVVVEATVDRPIARMLQVYPVLEKLGGKGRTSRRGWEGYQAGRRWQKAYDSSERPP